MFTAEAEEHWAYVECVLKTHGESDYVIQKCGYHFRTAMIHGYKHGYQDALDEVEEGKKS